MNQEISSHLFYSYDNTIRNAAVWVAKVAFVCGHSPSHLAYRWTTSYGLRIIIEAENRTTAQQLRNASLDDHKIFYGGDGLFERDAPMAARLYSSIGDILKNGLPDIEAKNTITYCELSECANAKARTLEICEKLKRKFVCRDCATEIRLAEIGKRQQRSIVTPKLRYEVLSNDRFACRACGSRAKPESGIMLHVDHIIPVAAGGKTVIENLQTLCSECNTGKGATLAELRDQAGHSNISTTSLYLHASSERATATRLKVQ